MKPFVLPLLVLALVAHTAAAEPVTLDYRAPSVCIRADRFADEVSAKLGFVPWVDSAPTAVRVRIQAEDGRFTGSVQNVDGSSKVVDGATCSEVTSSLAVTVAGVLDPSAGSRQTPAATTPRDPDSIAVQFTSTDGARVDVSRQTGVGTGVASNGAAMVASYWDVVCTSPCTAKLPRGRVNLIFHDPDTGSVAQGGYVFDAPATLALTRQSRSGTRRRWFFGSLALTAASIGGGYLLGGTGGILLASVGGSLGATGMMVPLFIHDTFTVNRTP